MQKGAKSRLELLGHRRLPGRVAVVSDEAWGTPRFLGAAQRCGERVGVDSPRGQLSVGEHVRARRGRRSEDRAA
jgi:hypothetical protein